MIFYRMIRYAYSLFLILTLTACGNATAEDQTKAEHDIKPVTRAECLGKEVKEDKIQCLKNLNIQRTLELAKKKARLEATEANIEKIEKENETLLKEFEHGVLDEK